MSVFLTRRLVEQKLILVFHLHHAKKNISTKFLQSLKENTHYRKKLKVFKIFRRSLINRGLKINNHFIAIFLPLHLKSIVLVFTNCKLCLLVCLFNRTSDLLLSCYRPELNQEDLDYIHFNICGDPCILISSYWCDLFTNRTHHVLL